MTTEQQSSDDESERSGPRDPLNISNRTDRRVQFNPQEGVQVSRPQLRSQARTDTTNPATEAAEAVQRALDETTRMQTRRDDRGKEEARKKAKIGLRLAQRKLRQIEEELEDEDEDDNVYQFKHLTSKANKIVEDIDKVLINHDEDLNREEKREAEYIVEAANEILKKKIKKLRRSMQLKTKKLKIKNLNQK